MPTLRSSAVSLPLFLYCNTPPTSLLVRLCLVNYWLGFAVGSRQSVNRAELTKFIESPRVKVVPSGTATADFYALAYAALRQLGKPIPTNDLWIAASCLEHGAALLTLDAHFQHVGGLRVGAQLDDFLP